MIQPTLVGADALAPPAQLFPPRSPLLSSTGAESVGDRNGAAPECVGCAPEDRVQDTITAISTGIGPGAIGIVKISGPDALSIAHVAFRPARAATLRDQGTYRLLYGHVVDSKSGEIIDEVLLAVMRAPHSYTREDVVELHCHGGLAAQRSVLRLVVSLGARLAEPGEFTRRAFLNGRIDLTQAESVAGIVAARSSGALRASIRQLEGGLSQKLRLLRRQLVELLAELEATVDFYDEEVDPVVWGSVLERLSLVRDGLGALGSTAFLGRALEQGVSTAIVGKPNVGKSSLLNALLMKERAIVSEVPGTTRDTVEELMEIGGIPIQLVDTAGIRGGGDKIEQLGVERSLRAMQQADLVLAVYDASTGWDAADEVLIQELDPDRAIIVGNKSDLISGAPGGSPLSGGRPQLPESHRKLRHECIVSAMTGQGLDELRSRIQDIVTDGQGLHLEEPLLATERQRVLVGKALDCTNDALEHAQRGGDEELLCEDIRGAARALGEITGEELTPDLLDQIFTKFCLGK